MNATEEIMRDMYDMIGPYLSLLQSEIMAKTRVWERLLERVAAILDAEEQRIRDNAIDEFGPGARP